MSTLDTNHTLRRFFDELTYISIYASNDSPDYKNANVAYKAARNVARFFLKDLVTIDKYPNAPKADKKNLYSWLVENTKIATGALESTSGNSRLREVAKFLEAELVPLWIKYIENPKVISEKIEHSIGLQSFIFAYSDLMEF